MKQRADLTFKQNKQHGRHGWLRLTPAYSVKLVENILDQYGAKGGRVFEPFSGTGTTPLCAAYRGLDALAVDINPFLIWLGRVKSAAYSEAVQSQFGDSRNEIAKELANPTKGMDKLPEIANIERWWNKQELRFVAALCHLTVKHEGQVGDLLRIVFCRTMIGLSNAAFNHQSMSFKDIDDPHAAQTVAESWKRCLDHYLADARLVEESLSDTPTGTARIELIDARSLPPQSKRLGKFDLLITSPPYPNRMSYIRELRPYMYWLGFLSTGKQAGELDWEAIGGTWGIATSRLLEWKPSGGFVPAYLLPTIEEIRKGHPKNGELMAQYVHKYFDDMSLHFRAARKLMNQGGTVHYVVGNSTFYGNTVHAERLYVDQLLDAGFKNAEAHAIRKRNSKKELFEFHVRADS
jgi:hypothetical protein